MKQNKKMSSSKKVGVGVGLAAAAAAAVAGAYFLYGKDGAKNRKKIKGWMLTAKGQVLQKMEGLENVSQEKYLEIVDSVMRAYRGAKDVSPAEIAATAAELKGHWRAIQKSLKGKPAAKTAGGSKVKKAKKSRR